MFRAHVLIIRRSKLHYTASGIITPIGVMIPEAFHPYFTVRDIVGFAITITAPTLLTLKETHVLTLQRGVTGTARMLHALTHSSISRQVREQM